MNVLIVWAVSSCCHLCLLEERSRIWGFIVIHVEHAVQYSTSSPFVKNMRVDLVCPCWYRVYIVQSIFMAILNFVQ